MLNVQESNNAQIEPNGTNTVLLDYDLAWQPSETIHIYFVSISQRITQLFKKTLAISPPEKHC